MANSFHDLVIDAVVLTHIFLRQKHSISQKIELCGQEKRTPNFIKIINENDIMWLRNLTNRYGMINDVISDSIGASFTWCKHISY